MTLATGTRLGQYEILSPLGAGGMGEVYRARDTRLGREVAIKVLPSETMNDPAARRRFEQEARAVAALSHPNVLAIHHFDTHDGIGYTVTELLEGETLRERLARSHLSWTEAAAIAASICDGMAAAHRKGIIHRDLKPANVFLTQDGQVKILDFGLARATAGFDVSGDATTGLKTAPGTVMGTLGYMSPEQLRGEVVDDTTDIFALGCILYEMVSGKAPFARSSAVETAAAILHEEPRDPPGAQIPPALLEIARRCLQKNRSERYQAARDVGLDLRALLTSSRGAPLPFTGRRLRLYAFVVLLLVSLLVARPWRPRGATQPELRSLIVVPFENAGKEPTTEYLSDGIAEELINSLARLPNVRVVARTTAFRYKGKPLNLAEMRRELEVDAVLSGRVSALPTELVIQVDLIDTASGTQLWGHRFHEQSTSLMEMEQQIVRRISDALQVKLSPEARNRIARSPTENPEAYKLYLQGRFFWNKRGRDVTAKAIELFEEAIRLDPTFALAYSGLADAHQLSVGVDPEGARKSEEAARAALRLDPDLAEAHASLGLALASRYRWEEAEKEFERTMEINPNYALAIHWHSAVLLARSRIDESFSMIQRAAQIDPLSTVIVVNVAHRLLIKAEYAAAIKEAARGQELDAGYVWPYVYAGLAHESLGQLEQAAAAYQKAADARAGSEGVRELCLLLAQRAMGNMTEARRLARIIENTAARAQGSFTWAGWACAAVGERDKAFYWLNRAFDARERPLRYYLRVPVMNELRGDQRYAELLRRLERGAEN